MATTTKAKTPAAKKAAAKRPAAKKGVAKKSAAKKSAAKTPAAKSTSKLPAKAGVLTGAKAKAYDEILQTFVGKGVERKPMFGADALNVGGKGFLMLYKGALVFKLPKARVDALVAAGTGEPFDPGMGRPMKEWISLSSGETKWLALAREAHAFVAAANKR